MVTSSDSIIEVEEKLLELFELKYIKDGPNKYVDSRDIKKICSELSQEIWRMIMGSNITESLYSELKQRGD